MVVPYVVWLPVLEAECARQEEGLGKRGIRKVCDEDQKQAKIHRKRKEVSRKQS